MPTTPLFAADLMLRAATLAPSHVVASGASRNAYAGEEQSSDPSSGVAKDSVWFEVYSGVDDFNNDEPIRRVRFLITVRRARRQQSQAITRANAIYDALHLSGAFTGGTSSARYMDVRCRNPDPGGPGDNNELAYAFIDGELWYAG